MVWVIVVVAIAVLGAAAWAGTGRLGEMPAPVDDRPKAHMPEGPVNNAFLEKLSLPVVGTGYHIGQVDDRLAAYVADSVVDADTRFDVVRRGYDMQAVDVVLDRLLAPPISIPDDDVDPSERDPDDVADELRNAVDKARGPDDPLRPKMETSQVGDLGIPTRGDLPAG